MQRICVSKRPLFCAFLAASVLFSGCDSRPLEFGNIDAARLSANGHDSAGHWLSHRRTWDEQRFSPLDDVSTQTVSRLGLSWSLKLPTNRGIESTPIVVDGTMFVTAGRGGGAGLLGGPMARTWRDAENLNLVLVFTLGGKARPPLLQRISVDPDPPPLVADPLQIEHGKKLYASYCQTCHGIGAEGNGILPDLRFADRTVHEAWNDIDIGGALEDQGMRSGAEVLTPDDALAIQAYVIDRALEPRK
jgi:mono/diheme cytochrome c family protein